MALTEAYSTKVEDDAIALHSGPKSWGRRTLTISLNFLVKLKQKYILDTYDAIMIIFLRLFRAYSLKKWVRIDKKPNYWNKQ